MIAIVDYGVGNLFSLSSSVRSLGAEVRVTRDAADLRAADHILLPGVGAFADAMAKLEATGLVPVLREETQKKPLLGICLGMQLLFEKSCEYGEHRGLGLIPGEVCPLADDLTDPALKVPHIGWNAMDIVPGREADPLNCYIDIQAGAGGTEACDWAQMLLRQYVKYAERKDFKVEIQEETPGDVAGIKSASLKIDGEYAYGLLRTETGVHRLVRKSPFDSSGGRHTSFASVFVYPEIDDSIEIEINPADVRVDTYRASGAGGQHINKTDSAVRVTHLPTGIVVECQDDRSQHKNKARALAVLASRIMDVQLRERQAKEAATRKSLVGSGDRSERIRTYNFPQGRVTDHRINLTLYKLDQVMDGDLFELTEALSAEHQAEQLAAMGE